jgi:hypothetical protein
VSGSQNILKRWRDYYSELLNVHKASNVRLIEIHTDELSVPDLSPFKVEIATAKLKRYKSAGTDQIMAELIQAGEICSEIHKFINSICNKEELPDQWKSLLLH